MKEEGARWMGREAYIGTEDGVMAGIHVRRGVGMHYSGALSRKAFTGYPRGR